MKIRVSYFLHNICNSLLGVDNVHLSKLIDKITAAENEKWGRVVMRSDCERFIDQLSPHSLRVLEISGDYFKEEGFKDYKTVQYPEYDICENPLTEEFDLIIAEQVFEHLLWPFRAGKNVYKMLSPGGYFLISTPFLVKIHNFPIDCTRWTEIGLKHFLAECGFSLDQIQTHSWGNRACIQANFHEWTRYRRRIHSLTNEPDFPYHIWAFARK